MVMFQMEMLKMEMLKNSNDTPKNGVDNLEKSINYYDTSETNDNSTVDDTNIETENQNEMENLNEESNT